MFTLGRIQFNLALPYQTWPVMQKSKVEFGVATHFHLIQLQVFPGFQGN